MYDIWRLNNLQGWVFAGITESNCVLSKSTTPMVTLSTHARTDEPCYLKLSVEKMEGLRWQGFKVTHIRVLNSGNWQGE